MEKKKAKPLNSGGGGQNGSYSTLKGGEVWQNPIPYLRVMQWDCNSECKYSCMHELEKVRAKQNVGSTKYYGKWPFIRVYGIQEVFSSGASFFNGFVHFVFFFVPGLRKRFTCKEYFMALPLKLFSLICMNSWFWSMVFHARDIPFTESMDYFFATSQLFYSLWLAIFRIARGGAKTTKSQTVVWGSGIILLLFYCYYLQYMKHILFDYGWHMKINTFAVIIHFLLWVYWSFFTQEGKPRSYKWYAITFLTLVFLAASCEVFDFPPVWGLVDAHATWHCLTFPMIPLWYQFWIEDMKFEVELLKSCNLKKIAGGVAKERETTEEKKNK